MKTVSISIAFAFFLPLSMIGQPNPEIESRFQNMINPIKEMGATIDQIAADMKAASTIAAQAEDNLQLQIALKPIRQRITYILDNHLPPLEANLDASVNIARQAGCSVDILVAMRQSVGKMRDLFLASYNAANLFIDSPSKSDIKPHFLEHKDKLLLGIEEFLSLADKIEAYYNDPCTKTRTFNSGSDTKPKPPSSYSSGITVRKNTSKGQMEIASVTSGSSAAKAGIRSGNVLVTVDDILIGTYMTDVVQNLLQHSKSGTSHIVEILDPATQKVQRIKLYNGSPPKFELLDSWTTSNYLNEHPVKNGTYTGEAKAGIPHGKGRLDIDNYRYNYYEGEFKDGIPYGVGKIFYKNGDLYEGRVSNLILQGKGRLEKAGGYVFRGNFIEGKKDGEFAVYREGVYYSEFYKMGRRSFSSKGMPYNESPILPLNESIRETYEKAKNPTKTPGPSTTKPSSTKAKSTVLNPEKIRVVNYQFGYIKKGTVAYGIGLREGDYLLEINGETRSEIVKSGRKPETVLNTRTEPLTLKIKKRWSGEIKEVILPAK